jgi:hypothetical protein
MEPPSPSPRLLVQIEEGADIDSVAAGLKQEGFSVERVLPRTGAIGIAGGSVFRARKVSGVAHVREEQGFQLPPIGGSIPQ